MSWHKLPVSMDVSELACPPDSRYCIVIITSDCALVLYVYLYNVSTDVASWRQQIVACFASRAAFAFQSTGRRWDVTAERQVTHTRVVIQDFLRYAQLLEPFAEIVNDVAKYCSALAPYSPVTALWYVQCMWQAAPYHILGLHVLGHISDSTFGWLHSKKTRPYFPFPWGGVRLSPLGTSSTVWPIVPALDDGWWWVWNSLRNELQRKPMYSEKTCPSATLPITSSTWPHLESNPGLAVGSCKDSFLTADELGPVSCAVTAVGIVDVAIFIFRGGSH
jgi:hypothetical protein